MSKEEVLKIQTCVLKVNIHCDGCQKKVKKILHKIEGVYQTSIDAEQGKVTVSGLVDPATIIKKLNKAGKPAELWGSKVGVAAVNSQFQKLHLDGGGGGKGQPKDGGGKGHPKDAGGKGQKGGGGGGGNGGGGSKDVKMMLPPQMPQPTPQQLQQLQQQLQMKGLKLPQFMDAAKMAPFAAAAPIKDPKSVKFNLPHEDDFGDDGSEFDDEFDEFDDEDDFDDDGLDEDYFDDPKMMKQMAMPPPNAGGGGGDKKGGGKKGSGGNEIPVQIKGNANNAAAGGGKKDAGGKQNQERRRRAAAVAARAAVSVGRWAACRHSSRP
uniref:HMA domain-containing protein n=1 Tax=Oryza meridionalis TaxID=40149 RepID=A0A0E0F9I6_9ORYZ